MNKPLTQRCGFTLVEAAIAAVVIAVVLALLVPIMRERERQRLQTIADSEPWMVFELHATPAKESYAQGEDIVVRCEIENLTSFALRLPQGLDRSFVLMLGDTNVAVGVQWGFQLSTITETPIGGKGTASIEVAFRTLGVGEAELTAAAWKSPLTYSVRAQEIQSLVSSDSIRLRSNPFHLSIKASENSRLPRFDDLIQER